MRSSSGADELSPTSYLGPRAIPNLFRGGKVTSGLAGGRDDTGKGGDTGSGDSIEGSGEE
ncbi:hypothetical protein Tco_0607576, partial [Tanacetum coccineum]